METFNANTGSYYIDRVNNSLVYDGNNTNGYNTISNRRLWVARKPMFAEQVQRQGGGSLRDKAHKKYGRKLYAKHNTSHRDDKYALCQVADDLSLTPFV